MTRPPNFHAIYVTLGETAFLRNSIRSVYEHVSGITVATTLDRDWHGRTRQDDGVAELILDREVDPDRKIEFLVLNETGEARIRNRAMDLAMHETRRTRTIPQHPTDVPRTTIDYFLIVDADEVWERADLDRLKAYVAGHPRRIHRAAAVRYFKRWNYRIDGLEWSTAVIRSDTRFNYLRNRRVARWRLALTRVPGLPGFVVDGLRGFHLVPADVAVFHHASWVGPRSRIVEKVESSGHQHEFRPDWLTDVYDRWTPESTDFHPVVPDRFPGARRLELDELPEWVRNGRWPASDYLD